jgi:hypothetical protein
MNIKELQIELGRWDYKPGWHLEIVSDPNLPEWSRCTLIVRLDADDAREPGRKARIQSRHDLPGHLIDTSEEFARFLQEILLEAERHEMREWLRRDGEIFDDPHKEGPPR